MSQSKNTKRALLASVLSVALCCAMLIGSTFAWFTDSVTNTGNRIQAGNLEIDLLMDKKEDGTYTSIAGGEGDIFNEAQIAQNSNKTLWEPGKTQIVYLGVQNKGSLALKYNILLDVTDNGLAGALEYAVLDGAQAGDLAGVTDWEALKAMEGAQTGDIAAGRTTAAPNGCLDEIANGTKDETDYFALAVHMKEDAGNEYQGKDITIDVTVVATQATAEEDGFGNDQYDKDAGKDTMICTLSEFNALTEIPDGIRTVYVNLNGISLENNITIGNDDIADHYQYTNWNDNTAPEGYPYNTGRTNTRASDGAVRYLYSTGKSAVTVILTGSVQGAADTGDFNAGRITLKVPDAANVVFDNVTFGAGQMAVNVWTESFQSAVADHRITSVTFNKCTFNGNWIQNGQVGADEMIIKACTFNVHENTAYKNNSNPIWIQNLRQCNVTIEDSTFNAVRPIKLWEQSANGTVTIKNNTFNMSNFDNPEGEDVYKNVAIMFCGTTEQVKLGNVEISGNTVTGNATGFICFYDKSTQYPSMNDGATFKLYDNTLNGVKESVLWKTDTEWKPDYVTE